MDGCPHCGQSIDFVKIEELLNSEQKLRTQLQAAGISVNELEKEVEYFKRKLHGQKENWLYTFAGQAMQAMSTAWYPSENEVADCAHTAVKYARALLAELEKETT